MQQSVAEARLDLTPSERQAYDLRHSTDPPLTWREIGELMGCSYVSARQYGTKAAMKLKNPHGRSGGSNHDESRVEYTDPGGAAEAIHALTEPLCTGVPEAARNSGLPESTVQVLNNRLQRDYQSVYEDVSRIKIEVFKKALERNAIAALDAITPEKYERASAYQLTLMAAISLDKLLLIEGKPTQNISLTVEDRRSVAELMAEINRIAEQRGYIKEVNPATNQVRLGDREDAPIDVLLHKTSKKRMPAIKHEDE